jgi:hypothetical protein
MNSTLFEMNPYYYNMASDALANATYTINATAQDFFQNQWPVWTNQMSYAWTRFQADPNNWIALYPLSLFFMAIAIWTTADNRRARDMPPGIYKNMDDMVGDNIYVRPHRLLMLIDEYEHARTRKGTHPMVRRSQGPSIYYMLQ